ncbi:hypothetical protein C1H46_016991 [Malus baccata]|uniref:Uncharacterized protein n=1 Tax=Malus baccata TaxID=106549 RepID=A0A540MFQ7_MALBA|nr:hypothetical protein C1H46_016991 [Malus baccata]
MNSMRSHHLFSTKRRRAQQIRRDALNLTLPLAPLSSHDLSHPLSNFRTILSSLSSLCIESMAVI